MFKHFHHFSLLAAFILAWVGNTSAQSVAINELVASNASTASDEDNSFEDWIELYNYGTTAVNLQGFGLTDDPSAPYKWVLPNVSLGARQYLIVWASDKNRTTPGSPLHANFKISASGETIVLTAPGNAEADRVPGIALQTDVAYGRQPDGTGAWKILSAATPGAANSGGSVTADVPVFSHASGLYQAEFNLAITHSDPAATIIYTLDGSEPDINNTSGTTFRYKNQYSLEPGQPAGPFLNSSYTSNTYSAPVRIYDRSAEADKLTHMNTRQHEIFFPPQPVRKGMVVKAKAYIGSTGSKTVTRTYFVWPQGSPYHIPVISYQIQENHLFDYDKGTYTAGVDYDTWRANNPNNNQWYRPEWGNYWRSGKDWEYPVHIEIFEPGNFKSMMSKNGGFRIHGNNSRALPIKSIRLYARDEGNFELDLFDEKIVDATNSGNKEFKRIMMRGEGTGGPVYYDVVFNRLMQPFYSGVTRIKPAIHFINGEYWGITALRDRFDEHYYALNYNLNPDNIIQVGCGGNNCEIDAGDDTDFAQYISMRDFIRNNDMANPANFEKADSMLSMESFIDHMVLEIYAANDSYERNFWKVRTKENQPYGDGKWRLNVQDFEASLKSQINWLSHWSNLSNAANESMLGHLLANPSFKTAFINRFADMMNTAFAPARFKTVVENTLNEVAPYLAEDINRFPRETFYRTQEKQNLINWADTRPAIQRDSISRFFNLGGTFDLTLDVSDTAAGYTSVNTITITPATAGVPAAAYPWTGVYFDQVPVAVRAFAKPGYLFSHWSGDVSSTTDSIVLQVSANTRLQANFIKDTTPEVVYFWLFDNSVTNDAPLQSLSATFAANSLPATLNYTSCLVGYPFDNQHENWRKASMERRNAPTPINYREKGNGNIAYANVNMRAIQIKQPMRKDTLENLIVLNVPTTRLENIKLSFAAETDGAAERLVIDYWNGSEWDTTGLAQATFPLDSQYALFEIDFSDVAASVHNPDFKARIRFDGTDMESDNGLRVHLNNIAIDGSEHLVSGTPSFARKELHALKAYPNPAQNLLSVESDKPMQTITVLNMLGQPVLTLNDAGKKGELSLGGLPASLYLVRVQWADQERIIRVIRN